MNYFLIALIAVGINKISSEISTQSVKCSHELKDIDKVIAKFNENREASNAVVIKVLEKQLELQSTVASNASASSCQSAPVDNDAKKQFARYYDGNERAFSFMKTEVERIFYLTTLDDSSCVCQANGRAINAMNVCGDGLIKCTDDNLNQILTNGLENLKLPNCTTQRDQEFFTKYLIFKMYFSAEIDLRKCKSKFLDDFSAEMNSVELLLDSCGTKKPCDQVLKGQ